MVASGPHARARALTAYSVLLHPADAVPSRYHSGSRPALHHRRAQIGAEDDAGELARPDGWRTVQDGVEVTGGKLILPIARQPVSRPVAMLIIAAGTRWRDAAIALDPRSSPSADAEAPAFGRAPSRGHAGETWFPL
jgi:hypothetical protein